MSSVDIRRTVDAVWSIESAKIVATLARMTGDIGLAEAQPWDWLKNQLGI